jgi:co-chaperonin GroES (HSP10)
VSVEDKIELKWNHILVRKDELPSHIGNIVLPQARADRPVSGVVLKAGGEVMDEYLAGDRVLFAEYAGHTFRIDSEEVTLLNPSEILGIIPRGAELDAAG